MSTTDAEDFTPSTDDVLQEEAPAEAVPVRIEGVVSTREVPTRRIGVSTTSAIGQIGQKLCDADPRRKSVLLIPLTQAIYLGLNQQQAQINTGAQLLAGIQIRLSTDQELWASAVTGTTDVSIIEEYWAE